MQTELNNGILTLTLPKLSAVRPEVVKVKVSSDDSTPETEVVPTAVTEPDELKTNLWAA